MRTSKNLSRREFIASTSAALVASQLPAAETKADKLAIDGGERTVKKSVPKHLRWGDPERERLDAMLKQESLFYWKGQQTTILTERFQKHYPFKYVMPCSSGTAAIHIAVAAAGIAPGDEVITTPITDIGTVIGILFQQAVPVFADLQPHDFNLSVADVERRITPKTKAIVAVHLGGNSCDLDGLKKLANKHNLILIEDCAQAWGSSYQGKPIGTVGHIACFSFQNSKHITCGDGGIVASSDEHFGPHLQKFGDKGMNRLNGQFEVFATNYRMSEPQAAVAAGQMTRLEEITGKRAQFTALLTKELSGVAGVTPHSIREGDRHTAYLYMIRIEPKKLRCDREQFVKALRAEGVEATAGYIPVLVYQMEFFQKHSFFAGRWPIKEMGVTNMDYTKVSCPEADAILKTCIRIPINESMDEEYVRQMAEAIRKVAKHYAV